MPSESITGPKYGRHESNLWVLMVLFLSQDILESSEAMESHSFRGLEINRFYPVALSYKH